MPDCLTQLRQPWSLSSTESGMSSHQGTKHSDHLSHVFQNTSPNHPALLCRQIRTSQYCGPCPFLRRNRLLHLARRRQHYRLLHLYRFLRHDQRLIPVSNPDGRCEPDAELERGGHEIGNGVCDYFFRRFDWPVSSTAFYTRPNNNH